jgi:hypothetical protein
MSPEALATASVLALGLFPFGHLALFLLDRQGLVTISVIFGHLSGYPAGALVSILSCAAGLEPALAWLLTAATYSVSLSLGCGMRWAFARVKE